MHIAWYTAADGRVGLYHASSPDEGRSFDVPRPYLKNVTMAHARVAATESSVWSVWEDPANGLIQLADGREEVAAFAGSAPSIAFGAGKLSLVWQTETGVKAYVVLPARKAHDLVYRADRGRNPGASRHATRLWISSINFTTRSR